MGELLQDFDKWEKQHLTPFVPFFQLIAFAYQLVPLGGPTAALHFRNGIRKWYQIICCLYDIPNLQLAKPPREHVLVNEVEGGCRGGSEGMFVH